MSIEKPVSPEDEPRDLAELDLEAWGIARTVKDLQEEVQIASPQLPHRELILQKIGDILALIPAWTEDDDRNDEAKRQAFRRHLAQRKK